MNLAAALFTNAQRCSFMDVPALLTDDLAISYASLDRLSNQAANLLRQHGVAEGDRILILLRDTPELIALFLGAVKAGIVPVVLSTRISPQDLDFAYSDSAAAAVFIEPEFASMVSESEADPSRVHERADFAGGLAAASHEFEPVTRGDGDPAFWVCSSGSTSRPKSVVHTHGGVSAANAFHRDQLRIGVGTRVHCTSKLSFAYPLSNTFLGAMEAGASIVLYPDWHDPDSLRAIVERHSPEVVFSTPTLYRRILHASAAGHSLAGVRAWVSAGEHLSASLCDEWQALTGRPILDCYGTSETLFLITATPPGASRPDSSGRTVPGVDLELRDHDDRIVGSGEIGELYVRHPFLAAGYINNPEQTGRRFRDGWFATGDLFVLDDDGYWFYRGREDSRIKIAGQWVHLQDVEDAVAGEDCIRELAALSVPDEDGLDRIALFVVPERESADNDVLQVVNQRLQALPTHKRPRWLEITGDLPRTNTGKIKRHELRERLHVVQRGCHEN